MRDIGFEPATSLLSVSDLDRKRVRYAKRLGFKIQGHWLGKDFMLLEVLARNFPRIKN